MKFGLESEKHLYDLKKNRPSNGVFRFIDALADYNDDFGKDVLSRVTNEFVLNMIEIGTIPSDEPIDVIKDYLFNLLLVENVSIREDVALVPLGALPMDFLPHILPKWAYYLQNSILDGKKQDNWNMENSSPLKAAGNCAGIHMHVEIETAPEFLFSNRELQDKFNMGLMMSPLIALGSSPYSFGKHEASSMRAKSYYQGVYKNDPLLGGLPPVMESSAEVLIYFQQGMFSWIDRGMQLGFPQEDLIRLTNKKGANWSPVRWNRAWNTIEIRCIDSDRMDLDAAKFILVCNAMSRMDINGEKLECREIEGNQELSQEVVKTCFSISENVVMIPSTALINDLFNRAVKSGMRDPLVKQYLNRLMNFAYDKAPKHHSWAYDMLKELILHNQTTSEKILTSTKNAVTISYEAANQIVLHAIEEQKKSVETVRRLFPDIFERLKVADSKSHGENFPFFQRTPIPLAKRNTRK
jgi:hypothetical protein